MSEHFLSHQLKRLLLLVLSKAFNKVKKFLHMKNPELQNRAHTHSTFRYCLAANITSKLRNPLYDSFTHDRLLSYIFPREDDVVVTKSWMLPQQDVWLSGAICMALHCGGTGAGEGFVAVSSYFIFLPSHNETPGKNLKFMTCIPSLNIFQKCF